MTCLKDITPHFHVTPEAASLDTLYSTKPQGFPDTSCWKQSLKTTSWCCWWKSGSVEQLCSWWATNNFSNCKVQRLKQNGRKGTRISLKSRKAVLGVPEGAIHQWREAPLAVENQKGLTAHKLNKLHYFEHLRIHLGKQTHHLPHNRLSN